MDTVSDIIEALGGSTAIARELDMKAATTVASWKDRGSIPSEHWPPLLELARKRRVALTLERLMAANRRSAA